MSASLFRRAPPHSLHLPLARCYAYLSLSMNNMGDAAISAEVDRFEAMPLHMQGLPRAHVLYEAFGDDRWLDTVREREQGLPARPLPFPTLKDLLRYLRTYTSLLDSKARPEETLFSNLIDRSRAWFITFAGVSGLSTKHVLGLLGPFSKLFLEAVVGHAFQSTDHYHLLLVSPWPLSRGGLQLLIRGLYPQSVSAVRNIAKARNYLARQSLEIDEYRAPYRMYIPEDMLGELEEPAKGYYNYPRYALPPMQYQLPMTLGDSTGTVLRINDVTGSALNAAVRLLGASGVYNGGEYRDQAVSTAGADHACVVIQIVKKSST